jgi:hypothetical protein
LHVAAEKMQCLKYLGVLEFARRYSTSGQNLLQSPALSRLATVPYRTATEGQVMGHLFGRRWANEKL